MERIIKIETGADGIVSLIMQDDLHGNTCSLEFVSALKNGLDELVGMRPKVLILRGMPEVFSAGATRRDLLDLCDGLFTVNQLLIPELLLDLPFPVIAAMEGHALGGGLMIGVCCDMVVMALESRYGATFMARGLTPGMGCTTLLAELVGPFLAAEMMFTGKNFSGSELAKLNTHVNYIEKRSDVLPRAMLLATRLAEKERETLAMLKETLVLRKKRLLIEARQQEHLMHQALLANPLTRQVVEENYPE
jgi:polyketide biosynthesis enoyl-CoA hydratase PksI